jgi:hypothetical protein
MASTKKDRGYRMKGSGSTRGTVTGMNRAWRAGAVIVAPEGEFDHLPERAYEAAEADAKPAAKKAETRKSSAKKSSGTKQVEPDDALTTESTPKKTPQKDS